MTFNDINPTFLTDEGLGDYESNDDDDEATKDGKRKERLEQNRISARESRKRKKNMIEELQRTVITLSRDNKELNERNEALRRELVEIGTKNPGVVNIQALMSCSGTGAVAEGSGGVAVVSSPAVVLGEEGGSTIASAPPDTEPIVESVASIPQQATQNPVLQQQQVIQQPQQQHQAQQQQAAMAAMNGINPQQLAMMQQMMALQQAGMMPQMMGIPGMMGMPNGAASAGAMAGQHQQQQQQQQAQLQGQQQPQQPPTFEAPK